MVIDFYYLFASSVAAVTARLVTYPIDTIKIRIQASTQKITIKEALMDHSFFSLFDGLWVTLVMCVPALSVYLATYDSTKLILSTQLGWSMLSIWTHLVSGCMAEVLSGLFFTPMEVIKGRMQNRQNSDSGLLLSHDTAKDNHTTASCIKSTYSNEGLKGFYKGYWITLFVFVPQTVIYFVVYEQLKLTMEPGLPTYLICSIVASTISVAVCNPLDVIKTRQQVGQHDQQHSVILLGGGGVWAIAGYMYRTEGWSAFIKGTLTRIIWGVPMITISMCVFEVLKDWHAH
ncbi:mitochondrial carrier domain-containing protein [Chlamydoabsidia padenii]|nr:mitochondrial carrier domain-containing protein [Chlamydoabsidia padenii]